MVEIAAISFGAALGAFALCFFLVWLEQRRGRRLVLAGVRTRIDAGLQFVYKHCAAYGGLVVRGVRGVLFGGPVVRRAGGPKAARPPHYPRRAFTSRSLELTENNPASAHLTALHKHRRTTALTSKQKERLRNQKLEERF